MRVGGIYIIEDVDSLRGGQAYTHNHSTLVPSLRAALEANHAFMVDSTLGLTPEQWQHWEQHNTHSHGKTWMHGRDVHNSHLLVIRRVAA